MGVIVNIVSAVVSIVSVVVLMVVENVLRAEQTLPSYMCRTDVILRSYWQSWTDKDRELRSRSYGFVTMMTDRGGLLWSGTSAKNDRHSVTCAKLNRTVNTYTFVLHNISSKIISTTFSISKGDNSTALWGGTLCKITPFVWPIQYMKSRHIVLSIGMAWQMLCNDADYCVV